MGRFCGFEHRLVVDDRGDLLAFPSKYASK
jgi:hypothetical protein